MARSSWNSDCTEITYHHEMPRIRNRGMSVRHFRRKLRAHPQTAPISGLIGVEGCAIWMVKRSSKAMVRDISNYLKRHEGKQITTLDLHVVAKLPKGSAS